MRLTTGRWSWMVDGTALRGDYVIRLDGTTCLQLWNAAGQVTRSKAIPQVATAAVLSRCGDCGPGTD